MVDATRKRIEWIFDNFDNIVVSISGGKDSTVLAYMTLQEAHKRNRKVGIFFLDEEVVYQSTIDQVRYIMNLYPENTIKLWYQLEFNLTNATSIDETQFKVWDHEKQDISNRMMATVQFNRARGVHQVELMSDLVKALIDQGVTDEKISKGLGMEMEEVYRLKQVTGVAELFKNQLYSPAWEMRDMDKNVYYEGD